MYQKLIDKWQRILRLQDYNITHSLKGMEDEEDIFMGHIVYDHNVRQAHITLLDTNEYERAKEVVVFPENVDLETTIVHELLHLCFIGMNDYNELHTEQQINHIAKLLVDAYKE